jgi:hypothetical protein
MLAACLGISSSEGYELLAQHRALFAVALQGASRSLERWPLRAASAVGSEPGNRTANRRLCRQRYRGRFHRPSLGAYCKIGEMAPGWRTKGGSTPLPPSNNGRPQ